MQKWPRGSYISRKEREATITAIFFLYRSFFRFTPDKLRKKGAACSVENIERQGKANNLFPYSPTRHSPASISDIPQEVKLRKQVTQCKFLVTTPFGVNRRQRGTLSVLSYIRPTPPNHLVEGSIVSDMYGGKRLSFET